MFPLRRAVLGEFAESQQIGGGKPRAVVLSVGQKLLEGRAGIALSPPRAAKRSNAFARCRRCSPSASSGPLIGGLHRAGRDASVFRPRCARPVAAPPPRGSRPRRPRGLCGPAGGSTPPGREPISGQPCFDQRCEFAFARLSKVCWSAREMPDVPLPMPCEQKGTVPLSAGGSRTVFNALSIDGVAATA